VTIADIATRFTEINSPHQFQEFEDLVEAYQRTHCQVYRRFGHKYLPVAAFKHADVTTFPLSDAEQIFLSSSTGGENRSRHYVRHMSIYEASVCTAFTSVFGSGPFTIWAHLPEYTHESSLVSMMNILMRNYGSDQSQFFLETTYPDITSDDAPLLLFGVAFGLLNLADRGVPFLPENARIIETGGMKTHRREITRTELHHQLAESFGIPLHQVWSEYGMCELLSQAYAQGGSVYSPPPWMRVDVIDPDIPERLLPDGVQGQLAITDLANLYTVSSILTEDLGVKRGHGFEVLGRLSGSALRGCNFLLEHSCGL